MEVITGGISVLEGSGVEDVLVTVVQGEYPVGDAKLPDLGASEDEDGIFVEVFVAGLEYGDGGG